MPRFLKNEIAALKEKALAILAKDQDPTHKETISTKVQKVEDQLSRMYFGDGATGGTQWANILSEVLDTKIVYRGNGSNVALYDMPEVGAMLVPLNKTGNHTYTVGKPALYVGTKGGYTRCCLRMDGGLGNDLQMGRHGDKGNCWRYATKEEIDTFFKGLEPYVELTAPSADEVLKNI